MFSTKNLIPTRYMPSTRVLWGNSQKALEQKPFAIKRIPFKVRREKFVLELIVNIGEQEKIVGYGSDVVWTLSEIFLSHFATSKHLAPNRHELAESHLFSSCIRNSDLLAVIKRGDKPQAFATFDFNLPDHLMFSKATFADQSLERKFGFGNLLNILTSFIYAEYLWINNPSVPLSVFGRTQHPLQLVFMARHSDRMLCSTATDLEEATRESFRKLARQCYPFDNYDGETGIARGVYEGPGAPPPAPEVQGFYEDEFASLGKEDALYFISEWDSRSSPTFQKSANVLNKIFGPEILYIGLFLLSAADFD